MELPRGSMVASTEEKPWRAAGRVSEAPQGDGVSAEKAAPVVSGEYAAKEALVLGMAIGELAAAEVAALGETSAEEEGAESGVLGEVSGAPAEATSMTPLGAAPILSSDPSGWRS